MIGGEVLDVVDKFDRVIGKSTRSEIHQLGLLHRSVHLLVFDDSGRLLLQKSCLLYTSPSPRDYAASRMPSSA